MARRVINRAAGFVHDIEQVALLSDVASNMRLLSDRSLYILQNLSGEDVTFLSRYGEIETGGYYLPVEAGSDDAETVYDAVNLIRRDLNDMTVEDTLACICEQLKGIAGAISAAQTGSEECSIGSDVETSNGEEGGDLPDPVNGIEYEEPSGIVNRKCKASNYIHGAVVEVVNELRLNRADKYAFAGLAFVLSIVSVTMGGLILGPFGLLLGAVSGAFLAMATMLLKESFSLTNLYGILVSDETADICALFEATTASGARTAYKAVLAGNGASSIELEFIGYLLTNNLLNLLFFAWGDSEDAIDNAVIIHNCAFCAQVLESWTFPSDAQSWTFQDDSTPPSTASMAYNGTAEALRNSHDVKQIPNSVARCTDLSPALSYENDGDIKITVNYGAPSDDVLTAIRVLAEFDTEPDESDLDVFTEAGQISYTFTTVDEIERVTVQTSRGQGGSPVEQWVFDVDVLDVTLERL